MNTTHRSIWNAALGAWVAVSEITRACGKRSGAFIGSAHTAVTMEKFNISSSPSGHRARGPCSAARPVLRLLATIVMLFAALSPAAHAQAFNRWIGPSGGDWFDSANWLNGTVPTAGQIVTIDGGLTAVVPAGGGSIQTGNILLGLAFGGAGALNVEGGQISNAITAIGNEFVSDGVGALTMTGGTLTSETLQLMRGSITLSGGDIVTQMSSIGLRFMETVPAPPLPTVTMTGGSWTADVMRIGENHPPVFGSDGNGTMTISGGTLSAGTLEIGRFRSVGTLMLTGTGTVEVGGLVGLGEFGTLKIGNGDAFTGSFSAAGVWGPGGGAIEFNQTNDIVFSPGLNYLFLRQTGSGTTTLTGTGDGPGVVPFVGNGTLVVASNSSFLNPTVGAFDSSTPGDGTLVVGGNLEMSGEFRIGHLGEGTLNILGGGNVSTLSSSTNYIGVDGGHGIAEVSGTWDAGTLHVGYNHLGELHVTGGTVAAAGIRVGSGAGGIGDVIVTGAGSLLEAENFLTVGDNLFGPGTGTLTIGDGGVVRFGTNARLTVGGTNATGAVNLNSGGTLEVGGADGIQKDATATSQFHFAGGTIRVANSDLSTSLDMTLSGTTPTVDTNGFGATFSGVLSGAGALAKTGAGTLTLSGANTYTGGTAINAGTLAISSNGNLGAAGTGISFDGGTLTNTAFVNLGNRAITLNAGGGTIDTGGGDLRSSGGMSGTGGLTKTGSGTLILDSTASNYSGATSINAGAIGLETSSILSSASAFTIASGASLQLSQTSQAIGSLAGAGTVENGGGASSVLTAGGDNSSTTFSGVLQNGGLGTLGLTKTGTGTLTLTGANTFSGLATVRQGTLAVDGGSLSRAGADLTVGDLAGDNGTLAISNGGTVSGGGLAHIGNVAGATGAVTVDGAGSAWTGSSRLDVGRFGTGTITITGGGAVSNVSAFIGSYRQGMISGTGTVTVDGAGSTWSNTGSLQVGALGTGTLNITGGGAVSASNGIIGNSSSSSSSSSRTGTVTVDGAGSTWSSNSLDVGNYGNGTLTIAGGGAVNVAGALTLADNATSFGSPAGTLNIGAGGAAGILNTASVHGGFGTATLNFNHTGPGYFFTTDGTAAGTAVAITGSTAVNHTGAGTTTLTGANTYSGGTTVNAGTLQAGAAGAFVAGTAYTVNGGTLDLNNFNLGASTLSGVGGTVDLGSAALTVNQAGNTSFAGLITGTGALTKAGTGALALTGANTYTGGTTVSGGTLAVNGSITSPVTVNAGGTLGGSGTVGNTSIAAGGVFAPGNSIGTLTVNGNVSFAPGSIYRVEVDAAGNADRINVVGAPGTATLTGGTVDVQAGAGTYAAKTQYTILNATGGVTGTFDTVTSNLAFLTPTLAYDANNVFLALARNNISFGAVAQTPNQIGTSTALQNAITDATGDMSTVINAVTGLSAAQARAAYDAASGAGLVALRNAGTGFAAGFGSQLQARLGAVEGAGTQVGAFAGGPILLAANDRVSDLMAPVSGTAQKFSLAGGTASSSSSSQGRGFWLRGSGGQQHTNSDGNAAASKLRNGGISAGFDAEVREGLVIGTALSSGTARLSFDNSDAGKTRGSALALYGSYVSGPWAFKGSASLGWGKNHMDRHIVIGGLSRVASSDFDSTTLAAYGEAAYSLPMNGWTLQPLAALSLSRHKTGGFTETGAGALNLQVAGQTTTSTKSLLGAKASFEAGRVRLEPRAIWAHEFGDLNTPMTAQFQGAAAASPFQVSGVALKRDTLILGLGATGSIRKGIDLFADAQAEHNSRQNKLAVLMGVRARW